MPRTTKTAAPCRRRVGPADVSEVGEEGGGRDGGGDDEDAVGFGDGETIQALLASINAGHDSAPGRPITAPSSAEEKTGAIMARQTTARSGCSRWRTWAPLSPIAASTLAALERDDGWPVERVRRRVAGAYLTATTEGRAAVAAEEAEVERPVEDYTMLELKAELDRQHVDIRAVRKESSSAVQAPGREEAPGWRGGGHCGKASGARRSPSVTRRKPREAHGARGPAEQAL